MINCIFVPKCFFVVPSFEVCAQKTGLLFGENAKNENEKKKKKIIKNRKVAVVFSQLPTNSLNFLTNKLLKGVYKANEKVFELGAFGIDGYFHAADGRTCRRA